MGVTWVQFREGFLRLEPGGDEVAARQIFDQAAARDGDSSTISEEDLDTPLNETVPASGLPDQPRLWLRPPAAVTTMSRATLERGREVRRAIQAEQLNLAKRLGSEDVAGVLSFAAGRPERLRLLDRSELIGVVKRLKQIEPLSGFRLASILSEAIRKASADKSLDAASRSEVIANSCEALLCLSPPDVRYALLKYAPDVLGMLSEQDYARVRPFLASNYQSIFGPRHSNG